MPAEVLTAAPAGMPLVDAAALPTVGLTAWQALFDHGGLTAGQRVLVNGAGGAVGGYAVQLAHGGRRLRRSRPPAPRSVDRVRAAGADEVVDHTTTELASVVTEPVDVVLNLAPVDPERAGGARRPGPPGRRRWSAPPCGCPPRPTRLGACGASTSSSAATPPSSPGWWSGSTAAR